MMEDPQKVKLMISKVELIGIGILLGAAMKFGEVLLIKILLS